MPQLDPDAPWLVNILLILTVLVVVPWLTNRGTKKKLAAMGEDITASRQQVENEHQESDYPNLRDEVTAIRDSIGGLRSEVRDLRLDVTGIRADARHDRRELGTVRGDASETRRLLEKHLEG